MDSSNVVLPTLLDLKKAFDTIDYSILLHNKENLGFQGNLVDLFKNYFSNLTQRVRQGKCFSDSLHTACGGAQGSVLNPMLFSIYMNGLA